MKKLEWANAKRKLSDLIPWPRNPRRIGDEQRKRLNTSLMEFAQVETIAIGPGNEVYNGHQRLTAWAEEYGDINVDVRVASRALTEKEREKLTVYLHKGAAGEWDFEKLTDFDIADLTAWGFDASDLAECGFDAVESGEVEDAEPQIDKAEELREKWGVEKGQLWQLGDHRLICGDCTNAAVVARVMGGEKADLCFTSPPYGQQRDYTQESDVSDWDGLMRGAFSNLPMSDAGQVLVNLGLIHRDNEWQPYWEGWIQWMRQQGWRRFGWYVWDQGPGLPGNWNGRLAPAFEWIFHFNRKAIIPEKWVDKLPDSIEYNDNGNGMRMKDGSMSGVHSPELSLQSTKIPDAVLRIMRWKARNIVGHPAMFPIELPTFILKCWPGTVYEPFLGSGTTLIACENLNRRCRAVEISPGYVAVALQRWADATGKTPILLNGQAKD